MNRALWLLIRLQLGGWFRYLGRNVRTLKGALLALVGLCVFVPWLGSLFLLPARDTGAFDPESLRRTGPALALPPPRPRPRRLRPGGPPPHRAGPPVLLLPAQRPVLHLREGGLLLPRRGQLPLQRSLQPPAVARLQDRADAAGRPAVGA